MKYYLLTLILIIIMPKVPITSGRTTPTTSKNNTTKFSPTPTPVKTIPVVSRGSSFATPKTMTNMQQARNDSTSGIKSPITRMPPQERARIDSTNAVVSAANKKDKEFRGFQARQAVAGRKSRGY